MADIPARMGEVPEELQSNLVLTSVDYVYNLARSYSLWPLFFGLACCAIEFIVSGTARYDLSRFGMEVIRASPRQCDLIIISGTVTKKMIIPIVRLYNQMAEPRYVVSMGACATGGGPFKEGYNVVSGVDTYLPVDVYVPGCPPTPEALLHGFMTLHKKIKTQSIRTVPWYRKDYSSEVPIPALGPDIFSTDPQKLRQVREINMQRLMASRSQSRPQIAARQRDVDVEQVIIRNPGLTVDLTGWKLVWGDHEAVFQFPAGFVLMSDSQVRVLSGPGAKASTPGDLVWSQEILPEASVTLTDAEGDTVSTFSG